MNYNGYHFTGKTLRDGCPVPAIGQTLVHEGEIKIFSIGLHFSRTAFQALTYARGPILHRVQCEDIVDEHEDDKAVCRKRTIVASIDSEALLRDFARKCALDVVHLWDAPQVVVDYLKTGDESLRAAASAASLDTVWDDAGISAWNAAGIAARNATGVAERNTALAAAWNAAAWNAAGVSAWFAAEDTAWSVAGVVAWNAAIAATGCAVSAEQSEAFNKMVDDAFAVA